MHGVALGEGSDEVPGAIRLPLGDEGFGDVAPQDRVLPLVESPRVRSRECRSCDIDELVSRGPGHQKHVGHAHRDLDLAVRIGRVQLDGGQLIDAGPGSRRVAGQPLAPGVLGERLLEDRGDVQAACLRQCPDTQLRGLAEPTGTFEASPRAHAVRQTCSRQGGRSAYMATARASQLEARVGLAQPAAHVSGPQQDRRSVLRCGLLRDLQGLAQQRDGGGEVEPLDGVDGRDVHPGVGQRGVAGLVETSRPEMRGRVATGSLPPRRRSAAEAARAAAMRQWSSWSRSPAADQCCAISAAGGSAAAASTVATRRCTSEPPRPPGADGSRRPPAGAGAGPRRRRQPERPAAARPARATRREGRAARDLGQLLGRQRPVGDAEGPGHDHPPALRSRSRRGSRSASRSGSGRSSGWSASCSVKSGWPRLRAWHPGDVVRLGVMTTQERELLGRSRPGSAGRGPGSPRRADGGHA